ncbi:MAG: DUF192 domain-containing protein, partial [Candidatus Spechtbacterales bacterium]|nr:DUF192 domain-containing protein [Candidatus Spechtbacterales bacterium]
MQFLKTKKGIFIGLLSAIVVGVVLWFMLGGTAYAPEPENLGYPLPVEKLEIADTEITVELAEKPEDKAKGLSGRSSLAEEHGMLFVFNRPGTYSFWMKEMNFPIDIIWIGEDMRVVDITKNAKPESYPKRF